MEKLKLVKPILCDKENERKGINLKEAYVPATTLFLKRETTLWNDNTLNRYWINLK